MNSLFFYTILLFNTFQTIVYAASADEASILTITTIRRQNGAGGKSFWSNGLSPKHPTLSKNTIADLSVYRLDPKAALKKLNVENRKYPWTRNVIDAAYFICIAGIVWKLKK